MARRLSLIFLCVAGGLALGGGLFMLAAGQTGNLMAVAEPQAKILPDKIPTLTPPALAANFLEDTKNTLIANRTAFVEADLSEMKLRVWENGAVVKEVPILTKGREGSWWETPAGVYAIELKEPNHFSGFGHVYQPWSMVFQGNFFIHGWPYYPGGKPVSSAYSGGCIRLATPDAKAVYDLVSRGEPVIVFEKDFAQDSFSYPGSLRAPILGAREYLAADLESNHVFAAKDSGAVVPIASITKLVTALVAAEYINLDKPIVIPRSAIVPTSRPRLKAGERYTAYHLLYPLLTESSNEAAFALSDHLGRAYFVDLMNKKAASLGMIHTHFEDPAGMGAGNVSTAEDLFLLSKYLLNNRSFILRITSGTLVTTSYDPQPFKDLANFNVFTGQADFVGGKVGLTGEAHETMLAVWNEQLEGVTRPVAIIVLGSDHNGADVDILRQTVQRAYGSGALPGAPTSSATSS